MSGGFPPRFLWGVATSAYQIEGGVELDGRAPSIWDTFCAEPGRVRDGSSGAVACDHRHRWRDDVALMASLGLQAYRFSISWPRFMLPATGVSFYDALVDELLAHGIDPVVTLFHWDLPQSLEDAGGWPNRDTAFRFAEYAAAVGDVLGDRVRRWSTLNEPWCASMLGYAAGVHAPGRVDGAAAVAAAHHLLLGHGLGVQALRSTVRVPDAELGISLNPYPVVPESSSEADVDAARRVDGVQNRLWFDPILRGCYPDDVLADFAAVSDLRHIADGDLDVIATPVDFVGLNYYRPYHVRARAGASSAPPECQWPGSPDVDLFDPPGPKTMIGWVIEPDGLRETLVAFRREYGDVPVYVHENGAAFPDAPDDQVRIDFLDAHLRACAAAIADGVDVRGYFVWSLLDNFEWAEGYGPRFGIVHVDYETQRRTPKASARWYAEVIHTNGATVTS